MDVALTAQVHRPMDLTCLTVFSFFQRTRSPENNNVTALIDAVRIPRARTDENTAGLATYRHRLDELEAGHRWRMGAGRE